MKIQVLQSLESISQPEWDALTSTDFPFAKYHYLRALEETGCLGARTGWQPIYLTSCQGTKLVGALVTYVKDNSYGEYIFDFAWAQAYDSAGLDYYPKLISAIPFTPATGPKILLARSLNEAEKSQVASGILQAFKKVTEQLEMSSAHALFVTKEEIPYFEEAGFFIRHSYQYHWLNHGYGNFQDFLNDLRSKRRKEVLRERAQAQEGLEVLKLTGDDLKPEHAESMYQFYVSTIDKMGGFRYLTRDFYKRVFEKMKDQILLVLARERSGEYVAGAVNYFGDSTLFGRYWGCLEEYRALHFELCYYQGIEFAIEKKLQLFEAGAQGEHKFQRGFLPRLTYSAHEIQDPRMRQAIEHYVESEKIQLQRVFAEYALKTPFSRDPTKNPNQNPHPKESQEPKLESNSSD